MLKNSRRDADEPLVCLVTNLQQPARQIADLYRMRWKIETLFRHLKTNGFSLEAMNLGTELRCRLLMAIVVFSYVLSIREGLKNYGKVGVKEYSDGSLERGESVFRFGINSLIRFCENLLTFCQHVFGNLGRQKLLKPVLILENVQ